jgi:SAM-dependent methyltransferase
MASIVNQIHRVSGWVTKSVRQRGVVKTAQVAGSSVTDLYFDWRFGTDTRRKLDTSLFEAHLANREHAVSYQPTKAQPFLRLLRELQLPLGSTFVDVGCGKGKVLLLAAQRKQNRFKRIVGLEFSETLCAQAKKNIKIFQAKGEVMAPIEVVQGDATQHTLAGDENVFFLYNPFDGVILAQFLDVIRRSAAQHPRQIWLLYSVPLHAEVVEKSGLFARSQTLNLAGNDVYVYTSRPFAGVASAVAGR